MVRSRLVLMFGFFIVALVCARLGMWQLNRLEERRALNAAARAKRSAPVVNLARITAGSGVMNRRVRAQGRYDHRHDIVIRSRVYRGVPGVEIVSPLVLADDDSTAVMVNRGFVPAPDAVTADPAAFQEPGTRVIEGIALAMDSGRGMPLRRDSRTTWARLDRHALAAELPYHLFSFYIRQSPDSPPAGFPRRLDPPPLDDGPHLNYAIQWFAFAGMAIVFAGIMARQKRGDRPALRSS